MEFSPLDEGNKIANHFPFEVFCKYMEKSTVLPGPKKKKESLKTFIENWICRYNRLPDRNIQIAAGIGSLYPILRLIIPAVDRQRAAYGIGEAVMARLFIKSFGLAPKGPDAQRLQNSHNQRITGCKGKTDLADVVFKVLHDRCVTESSLSLKNIHDELDDLAEAESQDKKMDVLNRLIRKATIIELKWFVRLVSLRDMSLGIGANAVLACLHPAAPAIWRSTQDLYAVCQKIASIDPSTVDLSTTQNLSQSLELFTAFKPMLCARANSLDEICSGFLQSWSGADDSRLCLELKYDGERVQVHKRGNSYRFFSRQGRLWTSSYGERSDVSFEGSLTPRLHDAFGNHVHECILDGEMMGFNSHEDKFVTKATGYDVKRREPKDNVLFLSKSESDRLSMKTDTKPCFIAFDILYLNGELLTERPLEKRKELLLATFPALRTSCSQVSEMVKDCFETDVTDEIEQHCRLLSLFPVIRGALYLGGFVFTDADKNLLARCFDTWVENGAEGLVAKGTSTTYIPDGRNGCGWWKIKPDYVLGLSADLDCLVVGAYLESSCTSSSATGEPFFTHFLCAILGDSDEGSLEKRPRRPGEEESLPKFLTFCRVSNGLTRNQLSEIHHKLKSHWKPYNRRDPGGETAWLRVSSERPNFWIAPRHSVLFEIHAAEMTASASFAAGFTLRFPRVTAIRDDKTWSDTATLRDIRRLHQTTGGNLVTRRLVESDEEVDNGGGGGGGDGSCSLLQFPSSHLHDNLSSSSTSKETKVITRRGKRAHDIIKPLQKAVQIDSTDVKSSAFANAEFCLILSSDFAAPNTSLVTKVDLEREILKLSGRIAQNPGPNTTYVVADRVIAKVDNLIRATKEGKARGREGGYDIVKCEWLLRCLQTNSLLPLSEDLVFVVRSSTQLVQSVQSVDDVLTSWLCNDPITPDRLRNVIFPKMSFQEDAEVVVPKLSHVEYTEFLGENFPEMAKPLCGANILLFGSENSTQLELLKADLMRLHAAICGPFKSIDELSPGQSSPVTHVVLVDQSFSMNDPSSRKALKSRVISGTGQTRAPWVVSLRWARDCVSQDTWLPEAPYGP